MWLRASLLEVGGEGESKGLEDSDVVGVVVVSLVVEIGGENWMVDGW
jgi:hypothetical protein